MTTDCSWPGRRYRSSCMQISIVGGYWAEMLRTGQNAVESLGLGFGVVAGDLLGPESIMPAVEVEPDLARSWAAAPRGAFVPTAARALGLRHKRLAAVERVWPALYQGPATSP